MGKKKYKNPGKQTMEANAPNPMDPGLMKAFVRGREAGYKEGKQDGLADMMVLFNGWIVDMDKHVKGVGPKTNENIQVYLGECIRNAIEKNKLNAVILDSPQSK